MCFFMCVKMNGFLYSLDYVQSSNQPDANAPESNDNFTKVSTEISCK